METQMNADKKLSKGFSLIEALVVVGVTVVLATILFTYTRSSEGQVVFFKEQSLLVSSILRTKAFAIETFQPELQPPGSGFPLPAERVCAWGVSFDKNAGTFTIFQDTKSGAGASCPGNLQYTPTEEFETFTLDSRVKIQCIGTTSSAGGACVPKPNLDVIFTPPDPTVDFTPSLPADVEAVVVLELANGTRTTTIRVGKGGQVTMQ